MLNIRNKVFETNSSSTHSLTVDKSKDITIDDYPQFDKEYIIKPFKLSEIDDFMIFETIEDKLRYFLTVYHQCWERSDKTVLEFMSLLQKIFPNTIFCLDFDSQYVLEDGEWFFQEGWKEPMECIKLMEEYPLQRFMIYGTIYYFNRDDEDYASIVHHRITSSDATILCSFSG